MDDLGGTPILGNHHIPPDIVNLVHGCSRNKHGDLTNQNGERHERKLKNYIRSLWGWRGPSYLGSRVARNVDRTREAKHGNTIFFTTSWTQPESSPLSHRFCRLVFDSNLSGLPRCVVTKISSYWGTRIYGTPPPLHVLYCPLPNMKNRSSRVCHLVASGLSFCSRSRQEKGDLTLTFLRNTKGMTNRSKIIPLTTGMTRYLQILQGAIIEQALSVSCSLKMSRPDMPSPIHQIGSSSGFFNLQLRNLSKIHERTLPNPILSASCLAGPQPSGMSWIFMNIPGMRRQPKAWSLINVLVVLFRV